jgi:diguanylate cyclase (GGDEF)-like protein/PAS domain S-box-containing protein
MTDVQAQTSPAMSGLRRFFGRLSLRQRFLVEPVLFLLLMGALAATFTLELQHETGLLRKVADQDIAAYDRYSDVFVNLSEQHMALLDLLHDAHSFDEAQLYDVGKNRLNNIHDAVRSLEVAIAPDQRDDSDQQAELSLRRQKLLTSTLAYRNAATAAVTAGTVNLSMAPAQVTALNEKFTAMEYAFTAFLKAQRDHVRSEIEARIRYGEGSAALIIFCGFAAALLLVVVSVSLSEQLSRSIETQVQTLTELSAQAGARVTVAGSNEIGRIAQAVSAFRQSLTKLQQGERALAASNAELTTALDEVERARAELEQRVQERTSELQTANGDLQSEVLQRREAERRLTIYAEVIRSTGEAVAITDASGTMIEVNPAYEDAHGRAREELVGTKLYPSEPGRESEELHREIWRSLEAQGHWTGEVIGFRGNGDSFPSWVLINTLRDESGAPTHYVCVSRDITALKRSQEELQRLAFYDSLTRLPNRALFNDRLRVALAGAERRRDLIAVMYLDLDGFKNVNDTLGHAAGDRLLIEIGERIGRCIRAADTLARTGGDEFTILLSHAGSTADVTLIAQRIVEAVAMPIQVGDRQVRVGTSIGISFYPKDGQDAETLLVKADLAMYKAKEAGRGQYRLFEGEMMGRGKERLSLAAQLEAALANKEFVVFYQPIVNAATGKVERAEALLRWQRPGNGLTLPEAFIPHAEESGLIRKIDAWVLERACRDALDWRGDGSGPSVCVNLSAISLQQPDMIKIIAGALERTGLPAHRLNIEVTERAFVADPHATRKTLDDIVALGVGLSLDDFGSGYSSLSHLTRFPINCIKLDRAFIERIGKDKATEELIRTLLGLAARLKLRVVAEGVEQPNQQTFLSAIGCDLMQGYRFVRPMPGDMLPDWLASNQQAWVFKAKRSPNGAEMSAMETSATAS